MSSQSTVSPAVEVVILYRERESMVEAVFSVGRDGAMDLGKRLVNFNSLNFPDMMEERGFPEVRPASALSARCV